MQQPYSRDSDRRASIRGESLCLQPALAPRNFHRYVGPTVSVYDEVVKAMDATGKPAVAVAGLIGDVWGRMRAAAAGELPEGRDVLEPVRSAPDLWELKWKLKQVGEFRLYHAEPGRRPDMVALRFHRKDVSSGDDAAIVAAQDAEVQVAASRYAGGSASRWGHGRGCRACL